MIFCILGVSVGIAISKYLIEPVYSSTTKIYFVNRGNENRLTLSDLQTGTRLTKDFTILVKSRPVVEQVITDLNLNITEEALVKLITVNTLDDTRILEITVDYIDPNLAKQLADAVARVSSERMVSVMDLERVNVVEEGNTPIEPFSPNLSKNIKLGGLFGVILASFIIMLRYLMNDSIKSSEDVEKYLGMATLSSIPVEDKLNIKRRRSVKKEIKQEKKAAIAS